MNLELSDVQAEGLIRELHNIIQNDRYPLSPRIVALKEILGMLRPEPERETLPPQHHYETPSMGRYSDDSRGCGGGQRPSEAVLISPRSAAALLH